MNETVLIDICDHKNAKSSAGPSQDIISLHGRRMVVASETEKNRRVSAAKIKRLTGGDSITSGLPARFEANFKPTHKLIFCSQYPPKG